jgi:hypothetical protein
MRLQRSTADAVRTVHYLECGDVMKTAVNIGYAEEAIDQCKVTWCNAVVEALCYNQGGRWFETRYSN